MDVYIFTGPSLPAHEARQILTNATYLPPVSQGDVYRVGVKQPKIIGIIDGYFEHVPSVWHKEILWAMSQGIHVFGSSSMGALRAAELEMFGMVGIGKIFEAYHQLDLEDDDEVAVAHASKEEDYIALSTAMVDIRETLQKALHDNVINQTTYQSLIHITKDLYYPKRLYPTILQLGVEQGLPLSEIEALKQWLPTNRVDQKHLDAIQMLHAIQKHLADNPEPKKVTYSFENTDMWNQAVRYAGELHLEADSMNGSETIFLESLLDEIRLNGETHYDQVRQSGLSRFLGLVEARWQGMTITSNVLSQTVETFRQKNGLDNDESFDEWLADNNLSNQQFTHLMQDEARLARINAFAEREIAQVLPDYLRSTGGYAALRLRVLEKHRVLSSNGFLNPGLMDVGIDEDELWTWYFDQKLKTLMPSDLHHYAKSLGYKNEKAFMRSVLREYCYVKHDQKGN